MLWGIKNANVNQNKATQGVFEFEPHLFVCHFVNTCTFVCFEIYTSFMQEWEQQPVDPDSDNHDIENKITRSITDHE